MSSSTLLLVFALFLICCVHQTEAQPGTVCVVLSTGNTNEDEGPVVFNLTRKLGTEGNCTVCYELIDESTQPNDILAERKGNVTFLDGQTMATVEVQINDDDEPEDAEQFRIILSGDCIGTVTSTSAIIADNDFYSPWGEWVGDCSVTCGPANKTETRNRTCIAVRVSRCKEALTDSRIVDCDLPECPTGTVCVVLSTGNTNEDEGPVVFNLTRKLGTEGNCTVCYELIDESTQPNDILAERKGNVTFLDGQTMATVEVQINDDDEPEDAEQFRIILSGDCMGTVTSTSAIIADNDFYSPWGEWVGDCSVTCGPANKTETRNRTCIAVRPSNCMQALTDSRIVDCDLPGCPTGWSEWGSWTILGRCRRCRQRFERLRSCLVRRCRGPRRQRIRRTCDTPECSRRTPWP